MKILVKAWRAQGWDAEAIMRRQVGIGAGERACGRGRGRGAWLVAEGRWLCLARAREPAQTSKDLRFEIPT